MVDYFYFLCERIIKVLTNTANWYNILANLFTLYCYCVTGLYA